MNLIHLSTILIIFVVKGAMLVRLNKLFQYIDGYQSDHRLEGVLHVGIDYSIFLRTPKPHDQYLTYELYESKNIPDDEKYKPQLLAVSQIPIQYIKEQLGIFRTELYTAMYIDEAAVPGTEVKTIREWQISRALNLMPNYGGKLLMSMPILRTVM